MFRVWHGSGRVSVSGVGPPRAPAETLFETSFANSAVPDLRNPP